MERRYIFPLLLRMTVWMNHDESISADETVMNNRNASSLNNGVRDRMNRMSPHPTASDMGVLRILKYASVQRPMRRHAAPFAAMFNNVLSSPYSIIALAVSKTHVTARVLTLTVLFLKSEMIISTIGGMASSPHMIQSFITSFRFLSWSISQVLKFPSLSKSTTDTALALKPSSLTSTISIL